MEYYPKIRELVKLVTRTFYDVPHCVLLDTLLNHLILTDCEFCEEIKMVNKEFNKYIIKLKEDRLVKHETKIETLPDNRQVHNSVYYFDFAELKDVVKYKIYRMTKMIEEDIKRDQKSGFLCVPCERKVSLIDAQFMLEKDIFTCDICGSPLVEDIDKESLERKHKIHQNMMIDLRDIINVLKDLEVFQIPTVDYFQALEMRQMVRSFQHFIETKEDTLTVDEVKTENVMDNTFFSDAQCMWKDPTGVKLIIDEVVFSNGVQKLFCNITEEDKDEMSESEYEKYCEMYQKYNL